MRNRTSQPSLLFDARYLPAGDAPSVVLVDRIAVAMTMPHNHPGIAGRADGDGCARCNAEHALRALLGRAEDHIDFTPRRPKWRVLRGGVTFVTPLYEFRIRESMSRPGWWIVRAPEQRSSVTLWRRRRTNVSDRGAVTSLRVLSQTMTAERS